APSFKQFSTLHIGGTVATGNLVTQPSAMTPSATTSARIRRRLAAADASRSKSTAPITARHIVVIVQNRAGTRRELKAGRNISSEYGPRYISGLPRSVGAGPRLNNHVTNAATA